MLPKILLASEEEVCVKSVKVKVEEKKLNLNIFSSKSKKDNIETYQTNINISCEMYKKIKVGDKFYNEENERQVTTDTFLPFPVLVKKTYTILEK